MNRVRNLVIIGGVVMIAIVLALIFFVPRTLAVGQDQPASQAEADQQICPLSDKQTQDSINAFAAMMPIFTHPRCINSHGAVDPFAANTNHLGGRIEIKFKKVNIFDENTGKETEVDIPDSESILSSCQDCHSELAGWDIPPEPLFFVGKDAPTLCHQMKNFFSPQGFVDHLDHDRSPSEIQFIREAFKGTRALDANGQAAYENATGNDYKLEPPPMTQAQFADLGRQWVKIISMEGANAFKGGEDCGCRPLHYAVVINRKETLDFNSGGGQAHVERSGRTELPLTFSDDGSFVGQATVTVAITETLAVPEGSCNGTGKDSIPVTVSGKVYDQDKTMHVKTNWNTPTSKVSGVCQAGGRSVAWSNTTSGLSSAEVNSTLTDGIDLPAFVDVSKVFPFPVPNGTDIITLTIKKIE